MRSIYSTSPPPPALARQYENSLIWETFMSMPAGRASTRAAAPPPVPFKGFALACLLCLFAVHGFACNFAFSQV